MEPTLINRVSILTVFVTTIMRQTNSLFSWELFLITNFVTSFLIASSVAVSFFFLKNHIAKVLENDGAFAMVRNFKLETLSYIAGSYYNTVLLNLPA